MPPAVSLARLRDDNRLAILALIVVLSLVLEIVVHWYLGIEVIYSHFFYIPVVLAGIWYGVRGVPVAILLGAVLLAGTLVVNGSIDPGSAIRASMFVIVGLIVGIVSDLTLRKTDRAAGRGPSGAPPEGSRRPIIGLGTIRRRIVSVAGIRRMKDRQDVPGLIGALQNPDPAVQYDAVEALGELRDPFAVPALMAALTGDHYSGIRWKAAEALGKIGSPAVPSLIKALDNPDPDIRWKAAVTLGEIGDARGTGSVIRLLDDDDRFVRSRAVYSLGIMGPAAVNGLAAVLATGDLRARRGAVEALQKIDDPRAIAALARALCDVSPEVRQDAAAALVTKAKQALRPILDLLRSPDQVTRYRATEALIGTGPDDERPPLWDALTSGDEDAERLLEAVIAGIEGDEPGETPDRPAG